MRFAELFESGGHAVTLRELYNGDFPDRDELFWDYVRSGELDTPLTVEQMPAYKLKIMLLSQYRAEHIDDITDMIDSDRMNLIAKYRNDPNLTSKIIVVGDGKIIDGNHRAISAALENKPINYVDLAGLDQ